MGITRKLRSLALFVGVVVAAMAFVANSVPAGAAVSTAAITPTPTLGSGVNTELRSVSCASASFCMAVGKSYDPSASTTTTTTMRWNGSSWSLVPSPSPSTNQTSELNSVWCLSPTSCEAVGEYHDGVAFRSLAMGWDGTSWTVQSSPNIGASNDNRIVSVSCTSVSSCVAVGFYFSAAAQTIVMRWDGSSWTVQPSPNVGTNQSNGLYSVSCVSASTCVAVGSYYDGSMNRTLAMGWDGASWSVVPSPNGGANQDSVFNSVSCVSALRCVAVGHYYDVSVYRTLVEVWDGTSWTVQPSASGVTAAGNDAYWVSCATATSCVAVGYRSDTVPLTMVMQSNGSTWSPQSSPNVGTNDTNILNSVSCVADWWCMAVGYSVSGVQSALAMSLTGTEPPPTTSTTTSATPVDPMVPAFTG